VFCYKYYVLIELDVYLNWEEIVDTVLMKQSLIMLASKPTHTRRVLASALTDELTCSRVFLVFIIGLKPIRGINAGYQ